MKARMVKECLYLGLGIILLSGLCAGAVDDQDTPPHRSERVGLLGLDSGYLFVESFYVPSLSVWRDKDSGEMNDGIEFPADLNSGRGVATKIGLSNRTKDLGFVYLTTDHNEHTTHQSSRIHGYFFEGAIRKHFIDPSFFVEAAAGVGGLHIDLPDQFRSADGLAGMLRLTAGITLFHNLRLSGGFGLMRWGHPGETYANSGFFLIGAGLQF
jgi:hypothetical protein